MRKLKIADGSTLISTDCQAGHVVDITSIAGRASMASSGLYADTVGRALAHLDVIAGDPARGALAKAGRWWRRPRSCRWRSSSARRSSETRDFLTSFQPIGPASAAAFEIGANIGQTITSKNLMSRVKDLTSTRNPSAESLTQAIGKSKRIKEVVKECATELSMVNTVLKERLDKPTAQAEVDSAVQKSEAVEAKVEDSADELTKVNEALVEEVRER